MSETPATPAEFARFAAARVREHFDPAHLPTQQVMCVAEEAGEFVGAWRRHAGWARRPGSEDDVRDELADVLLAAHVTAEILGFDLPALIGRLGEYRAPRSVPERVLGVSAAAGRLSEAWVLHADGSASRGFVARRLADVAVDAAAAADALGIDLDAAWKAKAAVIAARPWKESADAR